MSDSPPPVDFEDDQEAPDSDEEMEEASPFLDPEPEPETSAMDEIEIEPDPPVPDVDVNLQEEKPHTKPVEPVVETAPPPTIEARAADDEEEVEVQPKAAPVVEESKGLFDEPEEPPKPAEKSQEEEEEEEGGDTFDLTIKVSSPEKVGDGMSAYMTYTVSTTTTMPQFKSPECSVRRRFSDFLGLHQRLTDKHIANGRIIPPAPEKSLMGMTKVKFSKSEENNAFFLERRRAALERYLNRIADHPVLRKDEEYKEFLENPNELPKASDTAAFSGAGFMRLMKNVGDSFAKISGKKADVDSWFEEQQQNYEVLDTHLKKLHQAVETMINCRKDVCSSTDMFVKSVATLGNTEENDTLSRALSRLSEVEEKIEALQQEQVQKDLYVFGETVKDYIGLLAAIRDSFSSRVKLYSTWQSAQSTLAKKRESEVKLQAGGKPEKLAQIKQEIEDWEGKVEEGQKNFDKASKTLKREVQRFEADRAKEFKEKFVTYLETMMAMQQETIRVWEGYLPDAKAIA